ncbi:c-type cytochrome [Prosthecomicrobium sp. N25]|uniref:c-type cytochrome n=1 Tax=Prosthecomicrobium sp. N25 TaxID=3129254 RepID=UPI003076B3E1
MRKPVLARFLGAAATGAVLAGEPALGGEPAVAPPRSPMVRSIEGDPALGEYLSGECVTCHQLSGNQDGIPSIVGWPAAWMVEALTEFKAHKRPNPTMQTIASRLSDEEIAALAVYFESVIKHPPR